MTREDADLAVSRGVAFLNFNVERWRSKIVVNEFRIDNYCHCIIGQISGSDDVGNSFGQAYQRYYDTLRRLFHTDTSAACDFGKTHGFDCIGDNHDWRLLQAKWLEVLNAAQTQ